MCIKSMISSSFNLRYIKHHFPCCTWFFRWFPCWPPKMLTQLHWWSY